MSEVQTAGGSRGPARVVLFAAPAGAGRPVAVAVEAGWLLATAGDRVLLADAGTTGPGSWWPGAPAHLAPFPRVLRFPLEPEERALAALGGTTVVRHLLPEPGRVLDLLLLEDPVAAATRVTATEIRAAVDRLRFRHVLVSVPLERVLAEPDLFLAISDLVVVCFPAVPAAARRAGQLAHRLYEAAGGPDLVGVACYPEGGDPALLAERRRAVRQALAPPDRPDGTPPVTELLDRHYAADQPVLPILFDEPAAGRSTGYEQLLAAVTGEPAAVPVVPATVRRRYRRRLGGATNVEPSRIWVCYPPALRGWAEWVTGELSRAGAPASPLVAPPERDLPTEGNAFVVVGPVDGLTGPVREWLRAHLDRCPVESRPEVFQLRLPDAGSGPDTAAGPDAGARPGAALVDLSTADETGARGWLLAPFLLTPPAAPASERGRAWPARFPGRPVAPVTNAPPPSRDFVGRERELTQLREGLLAHPVQILTGPAAVGKSEIARVYASRFAFDYDVVRWVPARDQQSIQAARAELRTRPGATEPGTGPPAPAVPPEPGADQVPRWLLVYDDADDPAVLSELARTGDEVHGDGVHVVITSRQVPEGLAADAPELSPIEVAVLDPAAGAALLARRHPALTQQDARALVDRFGGEPLALRLAATALRERLARLRAEGTTGPASSGQAVRSYLDALADPPVGGIAAAVRATADSLRRAGPHGELALWLARMCVYLSPDGVSLDLLRTGAMTGVLAGLVDEPVRQVLTSDLAAIDAVVWLGARSGLLDVGWGSDNRLRIHRVVQQELAEATPADELRRCRRAVVAGLARCAPTDAELEIAVHRERLDELRRHLHPSGALESGEREARRWVLAQIQYSARVGGPVACQEGLRTAEVTERRWAHEPERDADLRLRLATEQARLRHGLGEYAAAAELQLRALDELRARLGVDHLRTLLGSRDAARYLRAVGRFPDARVQDNVAHEGLARLLGRGHPNTLRAAHNLAFSMFLAGEAEDSVRLQRELDARSAADTQVNVLIYRSRLGMYLRELGQYQESRRVLEDALLAVRSGERSTRAAELELGIGRQLALIHRWQDKPYLARRDEQEALGGYLGLFGPDHPETLAARLALAADQCAEGAVETAVTEAETAYQGFRRRFPDGHPYLHLCQLALAAFRLAATQVGAARAAADQAWHGLGGGLGQLHPWTLAAAANRLNVLAYTDPLEAVVARYDTLAQSCEEYLTPAHPYSRVVSGNRAALAKPDPASLRPIIVDVPAD